MIQRIQTLWLLLAGVAAILTLKFPFYSGHLTTDSLKAITPLTGLDSVPIATLTIISALGCLFAIFKYKDRRLQMRITAANFLVWVVILALYLLNMKNNYSEMGLPLITCLFAFATPFFLLLAFRGVYRDDRLIKSADRLR